MECLKSTVRQTVTNVIVGDFNMPKMCWTVPTRCTGYISTLFTNFVSGSGFTQFVDFCTHGDNLLDLVLSNDNKIVDSISAKPILGHSDHSAIDWNTFTCFNARLCGLVSLIYCGLVSTNLCHIMVAVNREAL